MELQKLKELRAEIDELIKEFSNTPVDDISIYNYGNGFRIIHHLGEHRNYLEPLSLENLRSLQFKLSKFFLKGELDD